jgi:hypothetical protein
MPPYFAALLDVSSGALLTLSKEQPIIAFLVKNTPDVMPVWGVDYPNYLKSFPLANADPLRLPEWTWNITKRLFEATPKALLTDRLRHASALAVKKNYALFEIILSLSVARNLLTTGVLLQESVYLTKRQQAAQYQADGYPEDNVQRYPYVLQYAELADLSMRKAAHEILFKAQLEDEELCKSEALRLKYFGLLKTAKLDTIDAIMLRFRGAVR